ncbi:unnamed protein product [Rotaria sp. Silwood1]|nr:unnamed protein product [Rotaria sp. Silwood1]CAF3370411.1 unnamed protein product [Rotaria sp. Silwood1]CAF4640111.1 unnamed protein product [Rotaria sp. Silwood1]
MERDNDDGNIQTPSTSRSNSINEGETNSSPPVIPPNQSEPSCPEVDNEQVQAMPETQFTSTPSSSSDSETDFVAINKSDLYPNAYIRCEG